MKHRSIIVISLLSVTVIFYLLANNDSQRDSYENPKIRATYQNLNDFNQINKVTQIP